MFAVFGYVRIVPKPSATKEQLRFRGSRYLQTELLVIAESHQSQTNGILENLTSLHSEIFGIWMMYMDLANFLDSTNVKPNASEKDIRKLCQEAKKYHFWSVCVLPTFVKSAKNFLRGSKVKIAAVVGFPFGSNSTSAKMAETKEVVKNGADEIDMVMNIGAFKSKLFNLVKRDIQAVVKAAAGRIVKVILETGYLNEKEIIKACQLAKEAKATFVKTSTGFGPGGATAADIKLMRKTVGPKIGVKASGGIRDYQAALKMIAAGATRIGTSSAKEIVTGETKNDVKNKY